MIYYIYKLTDLDNDITGYIGQTINPDDRLTQHIYDTQNNILRPYRLEFPVLSTSKNWKLWLGAMGIVPDMTIIDTITTVNSREALILERKYIAQYTRDGYKLSNDFNPAKLMDCPYTSLWGNVWEQY